MPNIGYMRREYVKIFKRGKVMKSSELLPEGIKYDTRLQLTRSGEFYLCLLMPLAIRSENQRPSCNNTVVDGIISLDPGIHTFMTGYMPNGMVVEWGKNDITRIYHLCLTVDKLQRKITLAKTHRKRYKLNKAMRRVRKKIHSLQDDVHRKLTKWLCEQNKVILLPSFNTSVMTKRGKRKITSKTARKMLSWCHYKFKRTLIDKTREYPWCRVYIVNEAYTSKTCGHCGYIDNKLKGSKIFNCPSCKHIFHRDTNGARNILLRYLTMSKISFTDGQSFSHLLVLKPTSFSSEMQDFV